MEAVHASLSVLDLPEAFSVTSRSVTRSGIGATSAQISVGDSITHRRLDDVLRLLAPLEDSVRLGAAAVFSRLAEAEARVHRVAIEDVHFHEVGALDAVIDVVSVVTAITYLRLDLLICSPVALGGGRANTSHGTIPIPGPAVLELVRGLPVSTFGGPVDVELATPTGVALATVLADEFGPMPLMTVSAVGSGAGSRDLSGHPNLVRLVLGRTESSPPWLDAGMMEDALVLGANVDDLDPQLWPKVLTDLLSAGASDAWLTPILMKKGRPAHTVSVLCQPHLAERLTRVLLMQTSTIGVRRYAAEKVALPRETRTVEVFGHPVEVKVAWLGDVVANVAPEWADVARVADIVGAPTKVVMSAAISASDLLYSSSPRRLDGANGTGPVDSHLAGASHSRLHVRDADEVSQ
jgi:uncharacterized protein (TIGR00299 family) protein